MSGVMFTGLIFQKCSAQNSEIVNASLPARRGKPPWDTVFVGAGASGAAIRFLVAALTIARYSVEERW